MKYRSFYQLLEESSRDRGESPALKDEKGIMTFHQLYEQTMKEAAQLRQSSNTCMGMINDGSMHSIITLFAAVSAGLQVGMLDGSTSAPVLQKQLDAVDADCIYQKGAVRSYPGRGVTDGRGKMLFFTSGTSSAARAVELTEESVLASAWNGSQELSLKEEDILLAVLPFAHVFGFVCSLLWPLVNGACTALGRGKRHLMDDCFFYRPTVLTAVPALISFLLAHDFLNPELKLVLIGAGDCEDQVLDAIRQKGIRLSFGYGLTETSSGVAISTGGDPRAMTVCHDERVTIAPDEEILIEAGPCMMKGYYKQPEETAAVLIDGVLHTGDTGWLDEAGKLHLKGRKKEMLVFPDGTKIYLPEYEAALKPYLGEEDYAVISRKNHPVLVIYTGKRDTEIQHALRAFNDGRPISRRIIDIVRLDQPLPLTPAGKKSRWKIQEEAEKHDQR
jgi:long-subunit acyl-CoA synthetase (AMP-forming)